MSTTKIGALERPSEEDGWTKVTVTLPCRADSLTVTQQLKCLEQGKTVVDALDRIKEIADGRAKLTPLPTARTLAWMDIFTRGKTLVGWVRDRVGPLQLADENTPALADKCDQAAQAKPH